MRGILFTVATATGFGLLVSSMTAGGEQIGSAPLEDYSCWKVRLCTGVAAFGQCVPQGFICLDGTCGDPGDGCSWYYDWECLPDCDAYCIRVRMDDVGSDCGPDCALVSYNLCACACEDLGVGTLESGPYPQCNDWGDVGD